MLGLNNEAFDPAKRAWYQAIMQKTNQLQITFEDDSLSSWAARDKDCLLDMLSKKAEYSLLLSNDNRWETQLKLIETLINKGSKQLIQVQVQNPNLKMLAEALNNQYPQYSYALDKETNQLKIDMRSPTKSFVDEPAPALVI